MEVTTTTISTKTQIAQLKLYSVAGKMPGLYACNPVLVSSQLDKSWKFMGKQTHEVEWRIHTSAVRRSQDQFSVLKMAANYCLWPKLQVI